MALINLMIGASSSLSNKSSVSGNSSARANKSLSLPISSINCLAAEESRWNALVSNFSNWLLSISRNWKGAPKKRLTSAKIVKSVSVVWYSKAGFSAVSSSTLWRLAKLKASCLCSASSIGASTSVPAATRACSSASMVLIDSELIATHHPLSQWPFLLRLFFPCIRHRKAAMLAHRPTLVMLGFQKTALMGSLRTDA